MLLQITFGALLAITCISVVLTSQKDGGYAAYTRLSDLFVGALLLWDILLLTGRV